MCPSGGTVYTLSGGGSAERLGGSNPLLGTIVYKADYIFIDFGCIKSNHSVYTIYSLNIFTDRSITWQY